LIRDDARDIEGEKKRQTDGNEQRSSLLSA